MPLGVTALVIKLLVDIMDNTLLLPAAYHPDALLGIHIPGLGVLLSVTVVLTTGIVVANFFGRQLVAAWEMIISMGVVVPEWRGRPAISTAPTEPPRIP